MEGVKEEDLKYEPEILIATLDQIFFNLSHSTIEFIEDKTFIKELVKISSLQYSMEELNKNKYNNEYILNSNPDINDEEFKQIIFQASRELFYWLQYSVNVLKKNEEILKREMNKKGKFFCIAGEKLKNDKEFVLEILQMDLDSFRFVSDSLKMDQELVWTSMGYFKLIKYVERIFDLSFRFY
jgi:hypothetical protein